jgi:multidrug efflux pump subunit AcrA (membrane-fusion protein)
MRRVILIIIGVIVLAGGIIIARSLSNAEQESKPARERTIQKVYVETVVNNNIPVKVIESGNLKSKNKIELFSEVQGIMEVPGKDFKPGSQYEKDDVMLYVRDNDFYANLQAQRSILQNLITSVLPDLRLDFPEVYHKWVDYLENLDVDSSLRKLPEPGSDKEKYFLTGRGIYSTYYTTKNMEIIHSKYQIKAPFKGVLTNSVVNQGTLIRQGQKLGELIDPSVYELEVAVSKSQMDYVQLGKTVTVTDHEKTDRTWEGKITRINGKVDQETQTIKVFIELRGNNLYEGLHLQAIINGAYESNAYEISRSLIVDESMVYIVNNGILELVEVIPLTYNENTVIIRGLKNNTKIISKPISGAYAGMKVSILERI